MIGPLLAILAFGHSSLLDITALFNFAAGLGVFLFILVTVLIFIFIYDNLRKGRRSPTTT